MKNRTKNELSEDIYEIKENLNGLTDPDSSLPSSDYIDYWRLRENRTFFVDYEIGENDEGKTEYELLNLSKAIINLNIAEINIPKEELKPIYIWIHSYGGDLSQSLYVCDLIKSSRIPIITIGMGVCMSAGFLLFLAGRERYAFKHTTMLAHSGSAGFQGTAEQIEEAQKSYKKQIESMKKYILDNTNIDEKTFNKNRNKDWYIDEQDFENYGICKIVEDFSEIYK